MSHVFTVTAVSMLSMVMFLSSCKENYVPVSASKQSCAIMIECIGSDGKSLLTDKKFTEDILIEGNSSNTRTTFRIQESDGRHYIAFEVDLPDQDDMTWNKNYTEATGTSNMTLKFGKQKLRLKCTVKYVANRPPATAGGIVSLEEVSCNNRTFKRSGGSVKFTLNFDRNGKLH